MAKALRITLALGCFVPLLVTGTLVSLYRASQQVPDFYEQALRVEADTHHGPSDSLEQKVFNLQNEVVSPGHWEATFTNRQINSWLAYELPRRFAASLPPGITDPRVSIEKEEIRVACRYESKQLKSIVSLSLQVQLSDEPNVVAIRVKSVKAGALPLPVKQFFEQITQKAKAADLTLEWQEEDGDPVALLTVPTQHEQYRYKAIFLEAVELREGEVYVAGHTVTEHSLAQLAALWPPRVR